MTWNAFNTHNDSFENAFETFCIQLFEHYLRRKYSGGVREFFAISGSGGDGGVEAYGVVPAGTIGLQAKWFRTALNPVQIANIKKSILTAKKIRPEISEYIICLPKRVNSKKAVKGNKTSKSEQDKLKEMQDLVLTEHPGLKITWWFENILLDQIESPDCQFIENYWFGNQFLTLEILKTKFRDQKEHEWLKSRYAPDLNAEGTIAEHYDELCRGERFRSDFEKKLQKLSRRLISAADLIRRYLEGQDRKKGEQDMSIANHLKNILATFAEYQKNIDILNYTLENNVKDPQLMCLPEYDLWKPKMTIESIRPTNIQLPVVRSLAKALEKIHQIHVSQYLGALRDELCRKIKIFFGSAGTGKTQGLAFCTSSHLSKNLPALIIPAKGTPCGNWTEILCWLLEHPGRSSQEIFTALEALAIQEMHKKAVVNKTRTNLATVLISVDGLEEDTRNWEKWYDRINDTAGISDKFPNLRFMFSARDYFRDNDRISENVPFEQVQLPQGGDISIDDAAEIYFAPEHFNIRNVSETVMARIESLYALKLFSELYQGSDLGFREDVHTDLRSLLEEKISALDKEFKKGSDRSFSSSSAPVTDALLVISQEFYTKTSLDRTALLQALNEQIPALTYQELELMLDFLSDRAILTRGDRESTGVIKRREIIYYVSYQSIIEHVISEDIYNRIILGEIDHIPQIALGGMVAPIKLGRGDPEAAFPNETITETILKRVFLKTGKLVGENDYLTTGIPKEEIPGLQMTVLAVADELQGPKYNDMIKDWLLLGHWHRQQIYTRIVRPATTIGGYFNAKWLHGEIMSMSSVYVRDQFLWADRSTRDRDSYDGLEAAIYPFSGYDTSLYPFDGFDQEPLIYAWCLSSPNRSFRKELRSSLLNWANLNIGEWTKLLELMLAQPDSQIWEDLASINLGLSHTLKDQEAISTLSKWALQYVFADLVRYQSSRVREGFRGIVEKAKDLGLLSESEVQLARPKRSQADMLPLAKDALTKSTEQFFPIVSDLAWYVLDNSYKDFLEETYNVEDIEEELNEQLVFLGQYAKSYGLDRLSPHMWAQAAAVELIRNCFGFNEKAGNLAFLPSHGEKGMIMYFAEKYVWQAVYTIQGYLSEKLPLTDEGRFLNTYMEVTHIPNPAEGPMHNGNLLDGLDDIPGPGWCIPENLVNSVDIDRKTMTANLEKEINGPDGLNLPLWLEHRDKQDRVWRHLYNEITLGDKNDIVYGRFNANMVLIEPRAFVLFQEVISSSPEDIYFLSSLDTMYASPTGSFYQNPSDIVAGKLIDEDEQDTQLEIDDIECSLWHGIVEVIQLEGNDERHYYLPSRRVRDIVGIEQLMGKRLKAGGGKTIGFVGQHNRPRSNDSQKLTCIIANELDTKLEKSGYQMVWFVEVFKRTTLKMEKEDFYLRRTRKYMVWIEDGRYHHLDFWDKESSS